MQQVDDVVLGPLKAVELLLTPLRRALTGLKILARRIEYTCLRTARRNATATATRRS